MGDESKILRLMLKQLFEGDPQAEEKIELSLKIWTETAEKYDRKPIKLLKEDLLRSLFALNHVLFSTYSEKYERELEQVIEAVREDILMIDTEEDAVLLMARAALTLFHTIFMMSLSNRNNSNENNNELPYIW